MLLQNGSCSAAFYSKLPLCLFLDQYVPYPSQSNQEMAQGLPYIDNRLNHSPNQIDYTHYCPLWRTQKASCKSEGATHRLCKWQSCACQLRFNVTINFTWNRLNHACWPFATISALKYNAFTALCGFTLRLEYEQVTTRLSICYVLI